MNDGAGVLLVCSEEFLKNIKNADLIVEITGYATAEFIQAQWESDQ